MITCPQCNSPAEGPLDVDGIRCYKCRTCDKYFEIPPEPVILPNSGQPIPHVYILRNRADVFSFIAIFLLVIAVVAFIVVLTNLSPLAVLVFEAALGTSFASYLIAQIVHIRANTEK